MQVLHNFKLVTDAQPLSILLGNSVFLIFSCFEGWVRWWRIFSTQLWVGMIFILLFFLQSGNHDWYELILKPLWNSHFILLGGIHQTYMVVSKSDVLLFYYDVFWFGILLSDFPSQFLPLIRFFSKVKKILGSNSFFLSLLFLISRFSLWNDKIWCQLKVLCFLMEISFLHS